VTVSLRDKPVTICLIHDRLRTPILKNQLGDSAGVFGAAWTGSDLHCPEGDAMADLQEPTCALCGQTISEEERDFCLANRDRFNGQLFCAEHRKRFSACPAMRWQPSGRGPFRR
jgi:hypothetical protein